MDWLDDSVSKQRSFIEDLLIYPMSQLAMICLQNWHDRKALDLQLKNYLLHKVDHRCRLLYVINAEGKQHSSNISDEMVDDSIIGQNLLNRPYLNSISDPEKSPLVLSNVYIDKATRQPCITVLHSVKSDSDIIGYIAADFGLKDLPLQKIDIIQPHEWRQIKGDPSIRETLFQQTRSVSKMDQHIDEVLDVVESLMVDQGVFHAKLHFSSSRATLWSYNDPYRYRLHVLDEIVNPKVCLAYEKTSYPNDAVTKAEIIPHILRTFKLLREADEVIYLRAASLNIMNGFVGLNFSCDGSHYMTAEEFLGKDIGFWFGQGICEAS